MEILEINIQHRLGTGWPVVVEQIRPADLPRRSEGELLLGEARRLLSVVEDPDLKPLRWKRLCASDGSGGWGFLALDQGTPYSRYLPSLTDRRFSAIGRRDQRAPVALADSSQSNKYELTPFDAAATAASIGKALTSPMKHKGGVWGARFSADETRILIWRSGCYGMSGSARLWDISVDAGWPTDKMVRKSVVEIGTMLKPSGAVKALSAAWQEKKWRHYDAMEYCLERITEEEWRTSQHLCREVKEKPKDRAIQTPQPSAG